jgi:glycosyltransferase involved in cell wall biosynthesis
MPAYNAEKYLNEAIDSILKQTYTNFEFIIINDGSSDGSEAIILSYDDERICYVKNDSNLKISETLNKGIALAKGKYIARMDADDISHPERLATQVSFMDVNPEVDVCGTSLEIFGNGEDVWQYPSTHEEIKAALLFNSALVHASIIAKKRVFESCSYHAENNGAEDYHLWVELIDNMVFINIPEVLYKYRLHGEQTEKTQQMQLSNKARQIMLGRIGCDLNEKEQSVFFDISNYKKVWLKEADLVLKKISLANEVSGYLQDAALGKVLGERFWQIINKNAADGVKTWFCYQNSLMKKEVSRSPYDQLKFFIKCVMRYSHG